MSFFTEDWARKYGYFSTLEGSPNDPTSINYGGSCAERIENLKRRGYGLYSNIGQRYSVIYWQQNCSRLTEEYRLSKIEKQKDEQQRLVQKEEITRSYSFPYVYTKGNELRIDNLLKAPESFKDNFSLTIQESEYTEDENGVRKFFIKGTASSRLGKRHSQQYVSNMAWAVANFETLSGKVTYMTKEATPTPSTTWSMTVSGIENLPDDVMKVKVIVRADGIGGSNLVTIQKKLISNISEETILKKQLENEKKQNEIKRKEITKVQPETIPEIIPTAVATSSLLPLGIIALLLYSRTGRK